MNHRNKKRDSSILSSGGNSQRLSDISGPSEETFGPQCPLGLRDELIRLEWCWGVTFRLCDTSITLNILTKEKRI